MPIKTELNIIAHRGASAFAPENTIAAFSKAVELKADAFELDVTLSKDHELVVIHDDKVDRTTNGVGRVFDLTFEELSKLDAGSFFDPSFSAESIPLLETVIKNFANNLLINIEIKKDPSGTGLLAQKTAVLIKSLGVEERVFVSSFFPKNLRIVREIVPDVKVGILTLPGLLGFSRRSSRSCSYSPKLVHPYLKDVNAGYVKKQHNLGRSVNVWTVNKKEDIKNMISIGVDGIITDDPVLARQVLGGV